jgi:PPOX class probable FMN-dependent enzyme
VTSEEALRDLIGLPIDRALAKVTHEIDEICRSFIAHSPFLLIASADAQGNMDISPKGDPPGFVHVLDDSTLLIPDRPGNRRADTFTNVLQNPKVALFFLVPGRRETLRVTGSAVIVRDGVLRQRSALNGKVPTLMLAVRVEDAFFHCAKCIIRSGLWQESDWPAIGAPPSYAEALVKHAKLPFGVEDMQAILDESYEKGLY